MISEQLIQQLVKEKIEGTELFLVDIQVRPGNKILIHIDSLLGLTVDDCVKISRHVEFSLDRDKEDFELQVSSPGADAVFKVPQQYQKYLNKNVEVTDAEGKVWNGKLVAVNTEEFSIEAVTSAKGANKKVKTTTIQIFKTNQIKQTKATISFK